MSTKKYVSVLAGAAVVVAAFVVGILGCEQKQNATHETAVKPVAGAHAQISPTPHRPKHKNAGRHTEEPASPTPSNR